MYRVNFLNRGFSANKMRHAKPITKKTLLFTAVADSQIASTLIKILKLYSFDKDEKHLHVSKPCAFQK